MKRVITIGTILILGIGLAAAKGYHKHRHLTPPPPPIKSDPAPFQPASDLSVCPGYGWQGGLCDRSTGGH